MTLKIESLITFKRQDYLSIIPHYVICIFGFLDGCTFKYYDQQEQKCDHIYIFFELAYMYEINFIMAAQFRLIILAVGGGGGRGICSIITSRAK